MTADCGELLLADGSRLVCHRRLRQLPGKREVFRGEREGVEVVAKVYLDSGRGAVHAKREASGLAAFAAAGLPAPELLYHGQDSVGHPVVIVGYIAGAEDLAACWNAADSRRRPALLRDMMQMLAAHHAAGLCQHDLHLRNFLIAGDTLYSIDGDAVERRRPPLDRLRSLRNLGLLGAQFVPETDALTLAQSAHYAQLRGWSADRLGRQLPNAIAGARLRRWQKSRDKLYRDCSLVARRQTASGVCFVVRAVGDRLAGLLDDPDASCPPDPSQLLKNGNTATVWSVHNREHDLVVKRYNVKHRRHGLMRSVKESRASISWRNAHMLTKFGIPTPAPLAFCIRRERPLRPVSYFFSEYIEGVSLKDWLAQRRDNLDEIRWVARQLGELFTRLTRLQITHGDMKAANFVVGDDRLYVIDLDAMQLHRVAAVFSRAWRRDMQRFHANWEDSPEVLEIMREEIGRAVQS